MLVRTPVLSKNLRLPPLDRRLHGGVLAIDIAHLFPASTAVQETANPSTVKLKLLVLGTQDRASMHRSRTSWFASISALDSLHSLSRKA